MSDGSGILWSPSQEQITNTRMADFAEYFLSKLQSRPTTSDYASLHQASIHHAGLFWRSVWEFTELPGNLGATDYAPGNSFEGGRWFPEAEMNFAEAMLHRDRLKDRSFAESPAIVAWNEFGEQATWDRQRLYGDVCNIAGYLHSQGVVAEDRVAAVLPNIGEAIVGMLASASLGAVWSSCSPDFGNDAICDRFGQIQPKVLITTAKTYYNGKLIEPIKQVQALLPRLPSVERVVVVGEEVSATETTGSVPIVTWREAIKFANRLITQENGSLFLTSFLSEFLKRRPFSHPLVVVYSSGTTGVPKCIVHGAGGSLVQHAKEHQLHSDLRAGDRLFFYSTTGWMMWNWLASGLASGVTLVLYDGSPFAQGMETLWKMASATQVTHFGAGARYYATLEKEHFHPKEHFDLSRIRCVMSTGSPLMDSTFDWIYGAIGKDLLLASISGGTDLLSCFVLGNPTMPVRRGEIQCKGLGMDVRVFDADGNKIVDQPGELVCASPFPSMPIGFWNDPDGSKYHHAYFDRFENCWCHGDWVRETPRGGFNIYGRSDATLNPGGVRIGTAEIYQQLETFAEISESLATVLRKDGDEQIVLFVRMAEGHALTEPLVDSIRKRLREHCSPRHVPAIIHSAPDLPRTISGKLSEIAVRNAISGTTLGNAGALANPDSLRYFEKWKP